MFSPNTRYTIIYIPVLALAQYVSHTGESHDYQITFSKQLIQEAVHIFFILTVDYSSLGPGAGVL